MSSILGWAQAVPQTRHDRLGEPKGSTAWDSPSLSAPPSGTSTKPPCLARARAIKRQLKLVQRTRVGLLELSMTCCDLLWLSPTQNKLSSVPSLSLDSGLYLWDTVEPSFGMYFLPCDRAVPMDRAGR